MNFKNSRLTDLHTQSPVNQAMAKLTFLKVTSISLKRVSVIIIDLNAHAENDDSKI